MGFRVAGTLGLWSRVEVTSGHWAPRVADGMENQTDKQMAGKMDTVGLQAYVLGFRVDLRVVSRQCRHGKEHGTTLVFGHSIRDPTLRSD